ncbi:MAG TPA: hypothetical protein VFQ45_01845, partial [Longimicrobium sp.]|nr:hypothetical protein [Longimicrobium sp.]
EYLSVLVSIIVGLGLSYVLSGVGRLVVARRRVRMFGPTLAQVALVFLAHVQFWWSSFGYGEVVESNFFAFLVFLLTPILLYLAAVLVLPDFDELGELSLRDHFYGNHRWFFPIAGAVPLVNLLRDVLVEGDPWITEDRPFEVGFALLMLSGAVSRSDRFQKALAVVTLLLFVLMVSLAGLRPG